MRAWTVHVPPPPHAGAPVLVREGFSWAAFLFGPLWLLARRLWLPALLWLLVVPPAVVLLAPVGGAAAALLAIQFLLGCHAGDLRRRRLARRGYAQAHVVVERDEERALARLLAARPDLAAAWGRRAAPA